MALDAADQAADALIALRQGRRRASPPSSVAKPSLDEVFLALTGHDTTVPDTTDDELEPAR